MIDDPYFARLIPELVDRTGSATRSWLRLSSKPLREHLSKVMGQAYGQGGSLLADPVFEAIFGWEPSSVTLGELGGSFLHHELVEALANPPTDLRDEYRFDKAMRPYRHQYEAWRWLGQEEARSAIITSGTGSGKTECFLVPILDRLVREWAHKRAPLVGVRALFLYPLNALINSQRDRLRAWTDSFGDGVRFCLYNGLTPETVRHVRGALTPNQIADRKSLRASPPPILLTNPTMLEYMLVRSQDAPILEASRGKLEWIVLDEAHTYIGSQAAELALLLRRVMHAFDVHPANVRFIATSATIGDPSGEAGRHLQRFLADLAGIDAEQVCVVAGQRRVPVLPDASSSTEASLEALSAIDAGNRRSAERYAALCSSQTARRLRQKFDPAEGGRAAWRLSELADTLPAGVGEQSARTLAWLDLLTGTVRHDTKHGDTPFLPLRAHLFHNVLPGLSACADRACPNRKGTSLDSTDWPFGLVFLGMRQRCDCGAPAYEVRACNDCDTVVLWAEQEVARGSTRILPCTDPGDDEFSLELDPIEGSDEEEEPQEPEEGARHPVLIANRFPEKTTAIALGVVSLALEPEGDERTVIVHLREADADDPGGEPKCPCCEFGGNFHRNGYRATRVGAPFLLGNILPTLLEYCPESKTPLEAPYRGRRMLSFTDSRQGTARIAIKIQQDAERNRMRGLVYQTLAMASGGDEGAAEELRGLILALEPHANKPEIRLLIEQKKSELSRLHESKPVLIRELANKLAVNASDLRNMQPAYADLDPGEFGGDNGRVKLAYMLLGREFLRRPKRLNNLETMGLVSVFYPALEKARAPSGFDLHIDDADWRAFLKIALDHFVRQAGAVDQPDAWRRWGGQRVGRPTILPPDSMERAGKAYRLWPQCKKGRQIQPRLVVLLAQAFDLDPGDGRDRDLIDDLLRRVWDDLVRLRLLMPRDAGRYLPLESVALKLQDTAWCCPVTGRFLDTVFKGITPYLLGRRLGDGRGILCGEPHVLPRCELLSATFPSEPHRLRAIRGWLRQDDRVATDLPSILRAT